MILIYDDDHDDDEAHDDDYEYDDDEAHDDDHDHDDDHEEAHDEYSPSIAKSNLKSSLFQRLGLSLLPCRLDCPSKCGNYVGSLHKGDVCTNCGHLYENHG
jgi:hypothetical protein